MGKRDLAIRAIELVKERLPAYALDGGPPAWLDREILIVFVTAVMEVILDEIGHNCPNCNG